MRKDGKQMTKLIGGLMLLAIAVLVVFYIINQRPDNGIYAKEGTINTEAQAILSKDIERNYPATVREVVKLYSRITKCWYNELISKEELSQLISMQRQLFDEEFLSNNPLSTHEKELTNEIEQAKSEKQTMASYRIQIESNVKKWETDGTNYASIIVCYMVKKKSGYEYTYEEFLLREDEKERWKIVGWRLTDPIDIES